MTRWIAALGFLLLGVPVASAAAPAKSLTLIYTSDVRGTLGICG